MSFGKRKHPVDGLNQLMGRAVIGTQGMRLECLVIPLAGAEISVNIGPAKPVNCLLGIADHQPGGRGLCLAVNALEDVILNGIGILKFVDHGDRILSADDAGQTFTGRLPAECRMELVDQIIVIQHGLAGFGGGKVVPDPEGGGGENGLVELVGGRLGFFQRGLQLSQLREDGVLGFDIVGGLVQFETACRKKPDPVCFRLRFSLFSPGFEQI